MHTLKSVLHIVLEYESEARFFKIYFTDDKIWKIPRALDISKAHGHDEISIIMLYLCDKSIISLLSILFQSFINTGTFPDIWRKSNFVLVYKKRNKRITLDQLITIEQSSCNPFLEKYLKELFSVQFLIILKIIILLVLTSLGSDLLILANINFSQDCMKFINLLILIQ